MCVVSMVTDHYQQKWPLPAFYPSQPEAVPLPYLETHHALIPNYSITPGQWEEYQELKRKASEYDARTGQPHCEKEGVDEWEQRIEAVLKKHGVI